MHALLLYTWRDQGCAAGGLRVRCVHAGCEWLSGRLGPQSAVPPACMIALLHTWPFATYSHTETLRTIAEVTVGVSGWCHVSGSKFGTMQRARSTANAANYHLITCMEAHCFAHSVVLGHGTRRAAGLSAVRDVTPGDLAIVCTTVHELVDPLVHLLLAREAAPRHLHTCMLESLPLGASRYEKTSSSVSQACFDIEPMWTGTAAQSCGRSTLTLPADASFWKKFSARYLKTGSPGVLRLTVPTAARCSLPYWSVTYHSMKVRVPLGAPSAWSLLSSTSSMSLILQAASVVVKHYVMACHAAYTLN